MIIYLFIYLIKNSLVFMEQLGLFPLMILVFHYFNRVVSTYNKNGNVSVFKIKFMHTNIIICC